MVEFVKQADAYFGKPGRKQRPYLQQDDMILMFIACLSFYSDLPTMFAGFGSSYAAIRARALAMILPEAGLALGKRKLHQHFLAEIYSL